MNRFLRDRAAALPVVALVALAVAGMGCSRQMPAATPEAETPVLEPAAVAEWRIIHVPTREAVSFEALLDRLAGADVAYLGEEHHNRHHVDAAGRVLEGLLARGRRPVLAIEMFAWDGQEALTRYVSDARVERERFLKDSRWKENWGGDFADYEPLIQLARRRALPVLAMNPPRALVRTIARQGLSRAMEDSGMARWGMRGEPVVDDPAYRKVIMRQLRECHGGMPDAAYERIYEASMFRDEGMAKTLVSRLQALEGNAGPIVSYTGGGHIQHRLPVPERVARRRGKPVRQITVYMQALEHDHPEYVDELLEERIADYVWLTPIGDHGPPARCG